MSEYTFETAALKAVTIDAVKYNEEGLRNSITPETIQAVAPIAWSDSSISLGTADIGYLYSVALGHNARNVHQWSTAVGYGAVASGSAVSVGCSSSSTVGGTAVGRQASAEGNALAAGCYSKCEGASSVALGFSTLSKKNTSITIGSKFTETTDSGNVDRLCTTQGTGSITIGAGANTKNNGDVESSNSVTIGCKANTTAPDSITLGAGASNTNSGSILIGSAAKSEGDKALTITLGSQFTETTDAGDITYPCSTEGTGSITIGAGANTLNNGDTESINSVTIGCKALNQGADSVVIGAGASNTGAGAVLIGGGNEGNGSTILVGNNIKSGNYNSVISLGFSNNISSSLVVAIGREIQYVKQNAVSIGHYSSAGTASIAIGNRATARYADNAIAIGGGSKVSDHGATVIRSTAEDGTITQLYFSGANTPLANAWEDGEAMMGYVVTDSAGNVMMDAQGNALVGTQKLSVLFPNNRGENAFTPAALNLDENWTPKPMFRPSDLDLPVEEPEVEEPENIEPAKPLVYKPQPVYPIVEPEIEEIDK